MSTKYRNHEDVPTDIICSRLQVLSDAVTKGREGLLREFEMRIPAELDRDADIVLSIAAQRLRKFERMNEELKHDNERLLEALSKYANTEAPEENTPRPSWIQHDTYHAPPLAGEAILLFKKEVHTSNVRKLPLWTINWRPGVWYTQACDPDGVPYCSPTGLEPWANYVATYENGEVRQYERKPLQNHTSWYAGGFCTLIKAPKAFRHPGDWQESLMRVWRPEQ